VPVHDAPLLPETLATVPEALAFWAETTPDAIALLSPGHEPARYHDLHDAVDHLAAKLRTCGLGR
jgi:non-ribosomal peptide synthetase component E (peptide arylation enzyme)